MGLVLKYRSEIYGFLALWIILFHIERVIGMPFRIPIITEFIQRGNCAVDVFIFLSGFCLCLSLKRELNLKRFYKKRFVRVIIPYLIIAIPFFIWKSIEEFSSMRIAHFLYDISGLSFWLEGCQNAWFVHAIIAFYILTPLLFKTTIHRLQYSIVFLILLYFLNIIAYYYVPVYKHSSIAWMRLPIFYIGIMLAFYRPNFEFTNKKCSYAIFIVLGIGFLLFIPSTLKGFYCWLMYGFIVIPLLWVIAISFEKIPDCIKDSFSFIGKISLEVYICHIMLLHVIRFYKTEQAIGLWLYIVLPTIAIAYSLFTKHISDRLVNIYNIQK